MYDILIIGGGPAGLTAGLYAARAGLSVALVEQAFAGGQASTTDMLENYPGFPGGIGGPELMMRFEEQAQSFGMESKYGTVTEVELDGEVKRAVIDGETVEAKAVILCMGAKRRELGVPGEAMNVGRGVSYCATCDGAFYRGKHVAVIGGGDTAVEDALYLARGSKVTLIHRRNELRARGAAVKRLQANENVEFLLETQVTAIERGESGLILKLNTGADLHVDGVFVAVGTQPISDLVRGKVELNEAGYVLAGEDTKTSVPGVFCAGDLRAKALKQVITAAADGAVAAHVATIYVEE